LYESKQTTQTTLTAVSRPEVGEAVAEASRRRHVRAASRVCTVRFPTTVAAGVLHTHRRAACDRLN